MPANAIEQKPVSKKRGRPPLHEDKGPQQSRVLKQHLRTKFLKNQVSAKDVHDDAVACWSTGTDVGNLLEDCLGAQVTPN